MDTPGKTFVQSLPGIVGFVLILGSIYVVFQYFDEASIERFVTGAGIWAPLALIAAKASTLIIAPLGGAPLYPIAGALFGFWKGFAYLMIGDAVGGIVTFYIGRIWGRRAVNYFLPDSALLGRVLHVLGSVKGLLVARIAFLTFPELISYAAGLSKIAFWPFIIIFLSVSIIPVGILVSLGTLITGDNGVWLFVGMFVVSTVALAGGAYVFSRYMGLTAPAGRDGDVTIGG